MKKRIRLTESDLIRIVKRVINEQTEGESEVIKVLDDRYGLSDELKQEISNALKSSECKNVSFQRLRGAAGLALWNRLVLNPDILNYGLSKTLFVLFHEMAHQYQYKKYGKDKMMEYYNEEISLSDAAKFLQNTEKVADEFAVRKLKSLERKGLIKLNDNDIEKGYENMSMPQFEGLISYFRNQLKQNKITGSEKISEFLYNMVKIESSDNLEVKTPQKDTETKSNTNVGTSDDKTTTLQNLEKVDGDLDLSRRKIESLGNLTSVGGYLDLSNSKIESLGNLTSVGGGLDLFGTNIRTLGNLKSVGGNLFLGNGVIKSLGGLTSVGGDLELQNSSIESLGDLTSVGGDLYLKHSGIKSLGNLTSVGGKLILNGTNIESLGNLREVGRDLDLFNVKMISLGNLTSVGGNLNLYYSETESLGNLREVGGNLDLYKANIQSFGNLKKVGGDLNLEKTLISKKYSEEEIRQMVEVGGKIYL